MKGLMIATVAAAASCAAAGAVPDLSACSATDDFPACSAPAALTQRVRKEIRALSADEWERVVNAMWILKNTTMKAGQTSYGAAFKTYDYFVAKHAVATTDARGDQAHFGPQFMTWHGAFVLEFEEALLAVDGSIGALPYWDQAITSPAVFDDTYFGADPTEATSFQVSSGPFANWPIKAAFDINEYAEYIADDTHVAYAGPSTGFLRCSDMSMCPTGSTNANPYSTRHGTSAGPFGSEDDFYGCTSSSTADWSAWYSCIERGRPSLHSGPHVAIGGVSGTSRGDFEDPVTSPNAPVFMFHHNNLERNKMHWMSNASAATACEYYGYPLTGATSVTPGATSGTSFEGINLNEVASSAWGFSAAELGLNSTAAPSGLLTHADLLCWLSPAHARYTFDSLESAAAAPNGDAEASAPKAAATAATALFAARLVAALVL